MIGSLSIPPLRATSSRGVPIGVAETVELSLVIPVCNEEGNLRPLYDRLVSTLRALALTYEIILIDDGSSDASLACMRELQIKNPTEIEIVSFTRNFGIHRAIWAGLERASGKLIAILESDLQEPPEVLQDFYRVLNEKKCHCVFATRSTRDDPYWKSMSARLYWWTVRKVTRMNIHPNQGMMRLFTRKYRDALLSMADLDPFFAGMGEWIGLKQLEFPVERRARQSGKSKFNLAKMVALAWSTMTSFSDFPLRLTGYLGLSTALISVFLSVYLILRKWLTGAGVPGWTSVIVCICAYGGVQLIVLSLIGKYLGKFILQLSGRPRYLIGEHFPRTAAANLSV